ncbi:MAG: hypothetical protein JST42_03040 [Bacteroidetes bacterium]|nr:hypothetical protein [Bacteroidota bacterium]
MIEGDKIEIPLSKGKLTKLLFFSVLFLFAGFWIAITDPQVSNAAFNNPIIKGVGAYGSIIMGLFGTYFFTKKLFDNRPGLILDEQGIYDNTSAFKFGLIPWSDICEISAASIQASIASKQHFITLKLVDPQKYIAREKNFFKKKLLQANAKSYGSPIHISTNGIKADHSELLIIVKDYFQKYRPSI